jgi:protein-S-isoprenylcysteine O-methyltransferase Ste14
MDLYSRKGTAYPQKLTITAIELVLIGLSAWLMLGPGEELIAGLFGFVSIEPPPARRYLILGFSVIVLCRMAFMMFRLMRRDIPWSEALTVPVAFAVYYVGFALLVLPSDRPLDWLDALAVVLFIAGSVLNTGGELQRDAFKGDPANMGKLYTGGLFSLSMHINFFGDILWVTAYALVASNPWGALIPLLITAFFAFYNVPMLDSHLAARYGEQFAAYRARTRRLIPFLW